MRANSRSHVGSTCDSVNDRFRRGSERRSNEHYALEARPRCRVPLSLARILNEPVYRLAGRFGMVIRPEKMDRNVGLVADDPAVVWHGRNVKKLTGA